MATTTTPTDAYHAAIDNITRLEAALHHARQLRADAIRALRNEGRSWADIEDITGLTRQRLNQLTREFPEQAAKAG